MDNKYLPALVCGFSAAVLTTIPGVESIGCCLLAPVAAAVSVFLYKKAHPGYQRISSGSGILLGIMTAVFAALFASGFEIIITYLTKTSDLALSLPDAEKVVQDMKLGPVAEESLAILRHMIEDIESEGFSLLYSILITTTNLITYSMFGILGGVVGTAIINKRNQP